MTYYNFITWYTNGMFIPFFRGFDPQIKGSKWTFFQGNHTTVGISAADGDWTNKKGEIPPTNMEN